MIYPKPQSGVFAQDAPESEIKPFDAWLRGLGIAFDETNGFPDMESFNGLLQTLNSYIKYLEQNGFAEWSASLEYPIGAGVRVGSIWYRAKTQNTNKPPATSQNDWSVFLNASDLTYADPLQVVSGQISIKDATTTQKGVVRAATSTEVANRSNVTAFINPSNVGQTFGASLSANGWCRLPNGLILQWGRVQVTDNQMLDVNLPTPFVTAFLSCTVSLENIAIGSYNLATVAAAPFGLSKIRIKTEFSYNLATNANYFAIGY